MAIANFEELCKGMCEVAGVEAPELSADEQGVLAFTVQLHDVSVTVAHAQETSPGCAYVLIEFGEPPADRELAAWLALMDANFLMLGDNAPTFSRNPANGQVILQYAYPFEQATALGLYQGILRMVEIAGQWRQDYFLQDDDATPGTRLHEAVSAADFA